MEILLHLTEEQETGTINMNTISLIDETFDRNLAQNNILSILKNQDGFSFSIFDAITNKYIALIHNNLGIEESIKSYDWLQSGFKQIKVVFHSTDFTLVPGPLFQPELKNEFASFNFSFNEESQYLHYNKIKNLNSYLLYTLKKEEVDNIKEIYPNAGIYHQGFPFLESILINNKNKSISEMVFVNIDKSSADICLYRNGTIEFYNNFGYSNTNELVYYILNIYETFQLNPEKTVLSMQGMFQKNDNLVFTIRKFVADTVFEKPLESIAHSYKFNEVHLHPFTNLLNLNLCE